jgi:hypothetical protein
MAHSPIRRQLATALLALALPCLTAADPELDADTKKLLVEAVEAATDGDIYNTRCRSDESGRFRDNLNKELVSNFRMTVLEVEDNLFPEGSYSRAQERMRRDFLEKLKRIGGCGAANKAGMREQLQQRYDKLMREIDDVP